MDHDLDCEICGRPGQSSWGGAILCENCYGTAGAVCSGIRLPRKPTTPEAPGSESEVTGVC